MDDKEVATVTGTDINELFFFPKKILLFHYWSHYILDVNQSEYSDVYKS
jgi:hypothetical protein